MSSRSKRIFDLAQRQLLSINNKPDSLSLPSRNNLGNTNPSVFSTVELDATELMVNDISTDTHVSQENSRINQEECYSIEKLSEGEKVKSVCSEYEYMSEYLPSCSSNETSYDSIRKTENNDMEINSPEPIYSPGFENAIPYIDVESPSPSLLVTSTKIQKRDRRKHNCPFCDICVGNYSRHLERNHADELQVQEFMNLDKQSKQRKKLIDRLRREGDFISSDVVPVMKSGIQSPNLIVCTFCHGYYSRHSLRRHTKTCYFNPDPRKKLYSQKMGHTLMSGYFGPNDPLKKSGILNMMKADDISLIAKRDGLICEIGRRYIKKNKQTHLLLVAKRKMRRLARLLKCSRELENNQKLKLIDILSPSKFKLLIKATKLISDYNEIECTFGSPSLAFQMGTLIKYAVTTCYSMEVQDRDPNKDRLEKLLALKELLVADWSFEVSSLAGQNIATNRFNKPTLIPAAENIKKFDTYLKNLVEQSKSALERNTNNEIAFKTLSEAIFCGLLVFNRRRIGELQRITVDNYLKNCGTKSSSSEFEKVLTDTEKIMMRSMKRIVVRGKRGKGVPILFTKRYADIIEYLLSLRQNFHLNENIYLFGVPRTKNAMSGYAVMRKHAKLAFGNFEKASLLTSTKLRKHLATMVQIFNMEKQNWNN